MFTQRENKTFTYDGKAVGDFACLSTDTKLTEGIANGSVCIEMDTSKLYFFDAVNAEWLEWGAST